MSASAGSGKTYNMAYRYIALLIENPTLYRHILAVTFTNKATDELKSRILLRINDLAIGRALDYEKRLVTDLCLDRTTIRSRAVEARNYILHDYNNFSVLTIDKFFQRIIRAFVKELGKELDYNLELQTDTLLSEAADRMLDKLSDSPDLRAWVMDIIEQRIEDGKSWDIKKSLTALGLELFKEEYRKVAITPEQKPALLKVVEKAQKQARKAVEEYSAAAQEFVGIMNDNALLESDFYQGGRGVAGYMQRAAAGLLAPPNSYVLSAINDGQWCSKTSRNRSLIDGSLAEALKGAAEKTLELLPQAYAQENSAMLLGHYWRDFALLADLRRCLNELCSEQNILPISDVNELIAKLISDSDAPFIYEKSGNRYSHYMIDEFQDTSSQQWQNFIPLLRNALSQDEGAPVMLVGDVKQSIYRWRGGDWSLLARGVEEEFKEVERSSLVHNFRSKREIVEFNNRLMESVKNSINSAISKQLDAAHEAGFLTNHNTLQQLKNTIEGAYGDLRQLPNQTSDGGYVSVMEHDHTSDAPHPLLARIEELQERGYRARDIAVLVRTNAEAKHFSSLILEHKNTHPDSPYTFDLVTQEALEISSSPAVRFVVSALALSINPADRLAIAGLNSFLGYPFEQQLGPDDEQFIRQLSLLQPEEAFNEIVLHYPQVCTPSEVPYLQALHNQIIEFCARRIADTSLFVEWWEESGCKKSIALPEEANAITIVTIHKSKGLGYKVVIIPHCSWPITTMADSTLWAAPNSPISESISHFPIPYRKAMAESNFSHSYYTELTLSSVDALNTLYVALTRAGEELHIILPATLRTKGDQIGPLVRHAIESMVQNNTVQPLSATFGHPSLVHFAPGQETSQSHFRTFSPSGKVAVSFSHQRYSPTEEPLVIAPRDMGTLLHKAFEQARSYEEIIANISLLQTNGEVSPEEAEILRKRIARAFESGPVEEWFSDRWDSVFAEREIIFQGHIYRPDRVMVEGRERAVIIDYKFGSLRPASHSRQIENYARLLGQMGYKKVEAYLWYISAEEIVQVI